MSRKTLASPIPQVAVPHRASSLSLTVPQPTGRPSAASPSARRIAIELDYPAYDCLYLALAAEQNCQFVTADERFRRKLSQTRRSAFRDKVALLSEAAT